MRKWIHILGIAFLASLVVACAAKQPAPVPEPPAPPPEIVETEIQPEPEVVKQPAPKPILAKVTAYRLNVRKTASSKAQIVGVLKKDDEVVVQSKKRKWINIHSRTGLQGWVFERYLTVTDGRTLDEALKTINDTGDPEGKIKKKSKDNNKVSSPIKEQTIDTGTTTKNVPAKKQVKKKITPRVDPSLFRTPINKAIRKMFQDSGDEALLGNITAISSNNLGGFALGTIRFANGDRNKPIKAYVFKENGRWMAYRRVPTKKDHPGMFWMLAQKHCANSYAAFHGIGYGEGDWKDTHPTRRDIQFICSELINDKWTDHPLMFSFGFNETNGWRIVDIKEKDSNGDWRAITINTDGNAKTISQLSLALASQSEKARHSDEIVDRFFISILVGDKVSVKKYLDTGISPNVKRPRLGHSPLFAAVMGHKDDIAQMIIDAGGDVHFKAENGLTPLILAAGNCNSVSLVKTLIHKGANVNARTENAETPLLGAITNRCGEIEGILRRAGAK